MRTSLLNVSTRAALLTALILPPVHAAEGIVNYELQMGGPVHLTYACIFSGTVTCRGKACAGARVEADLAGAHDQAAVETAQADAQGRYVLKITMDAAPQEETTWKLIAKTDGISGEPTEVEGRTILMDETTVVIERAIRIEASGA